MACALVEPSCPVAKPTVCYWKKIWKGLNVMRQNWQFCDVVLTSSDNKHFTAHRAMLVASSVTFMNYFSTEDFRNKIDADSRPILHFSEVPSEILQVVLDFIYGVTPTTPFDMLKLCVGSKYFAIQEAYEYSTKYFSQNEKSQTLLQTNPKDSISSTSLIVQTPTDNQTKHVGIDVPVLPSFPSSHVTANHPCTFHGLLSPDITDSDSSDNAMAELSLTDLALGNECPHLKKLVNGASNIDLDFDVNLSEELDLKEEHCLNELNNIHVENSMELPNFLTKTSESTAQHQQFFQKTCHSMNQIEAFSIPVNERSNIISNKEMSNNFFQFPFDATEATNQEESIILNTTHLNVPTGYSEILDENILGDSRMGGSIGEMSFQSFESHSYNPHLMYDNTNSSPETLQNFYGDSVVDIQLTLNTMAPDLIESPYLRQDPEGYKTKNNDAITKKVHKFVCLDCNESFSTSYKLQTHQLKQHNKGKLFSCTHCPFKSPRKKDLQAHSLSQHGEKPPGVKIYTCTSCDYKCIDKNRFEEHEAIHQGVLKFSCPLCSKAYTTRRGMKTHLKYHNENRPFKCSLCPSDFKVKSKLTDHMKLIHFQKGVKPYKCGYCNHFTALRGNCNQHIKKNHPGQPVLVIDTMSSTRKHIKNYDYANLHGSDIDELHEICSTHLVKKPVT